MSAQQASLPRHAIDARLNPQHWPMSDHAGSRLGRAQLILFKMNLGNVGKKLLRGLYDTDEIVSSGICVRSYNKNVPVVERCIALQDETLKRVLFGDSSQIRQIPRRTQHASIHWSAATAKARFQTRRDLRTQRAPVVRGSCYQSILEIGRQAEVGLYIVRGHHRIIQAKCLHASKQSATLKTKHSAT